MPRLIMLDGYRLESFLDGKLFVFSHNDVPGIIGQVGTVFGKHGVNIAQMAVGREGNIPGGPSIGVFSVDGDCRRSGERNRSDRIGHASQNDRFATRWRNAKLAGLTVLPSIRLSQGRLNHRHPCCSAPYR